MSTTPLQLHIRAKKISALALAVPSKAKPEKKRKLLFVLQLPSQRHALTFDLRNPLIDAILCHVIFVVLITREAQKLIALYALGLLMLISPSVHIAHHLRTSSRKGLMQLLDAITEIVAISLRVATAEDSHGLASKVDTLDIIQQVVPRCTRAVLICTCVPGRAAH